MIRIKGKVQIDRIICFRCGEFDDFARDCPYMTAAEKQSDQKQQLMDTEEQDSTLKLIQNEDTIA